MRHSNSTEMQYLTFADGDTMPIIGLGTWQARRDEVPDAIRSAIRLGYRHIDCAYIYNNEPAVGDTLKELMSNGEVQREELWITSKLWNDAHEPQYVEEALHRSLKDLKLDYLDLYLIHWPVAFKRGVKSPKVASDFLRLRSVPLPDTWNALSECKAKGLVRHIGVSNFSVTKLTALMASGVEKPEVNQFEVHPYLAQDDLVDFCHSKEIHVTAYASLGSKAHPVPGQEEVRLLENPVVRDIALRRGMTPAQVLLKWSIDRGLAVIPKSVNAGRQKQNLESINFFLSDADTEALNALNVNRRFVSGAFWEMPGSPYTRTTIWDQ